MNDLAAGVFVIGYVLLMIWVFLFSFRLNMARGGRSVAACFLRALVAAYFAYIMAPYYLFRYVAARRRVRRVMEGGEPVEQVYRT